MSTRFPILWFVLFAVFLLFTCTNSTFADSDLIVTTDLMKIKQIPTVTMSPDGKTIAYVVKGIEKAEPESSEATKEGSNESKQEKYLYRSQIYLVPSDGSAASRQVTYDEKGATDPAWSP